MIDANDKATQALDLGEQKKRRGRPATGKAMTNAERQRAYRERQKAKRGETPAGSPVTYEELVLIAREIGARCKAAEDRVKQLEMQVAQLQQKLTEETKKRRHRDDPPIELQIED